MWVASQCMHVHAPLCMGCMNLRNHCDPPPATAHDADFGMLLHGKRCKQKALVHVLQVESNLSIYLPSPARSIQYLRTVPLAMS